MRRPGHRRASGALLAEFAFASVLWVAVLAGLVQIARRSLLLGRAEALARYAALVVSALPADPAAASAEVDDYRIRIGAARCRWSSGPERSDPSAAFYALVAVDVSCDDAAPLGAPLPPVRTRLVVEAEPS